MKNVAHPSIRIIIADDHELVRYGLTIMLNKQPNMKIVAEAGNGEELVAMAREFHPDIIITDIEMPDMDGIAAARIIGQEQPGVGIIALSMYDDSYYIVDMIEAGAMGYLLKNANKEEVIKAIQSVYNNETFYNGQIAIKLNYLIASNQFNYLKERTEIKFTDREREVINLLCKEYTSKRMADELHLSSRTVEGHRKALLEKMQCNNTAGIVAYAFRYKLVSSK